MKAKTSSTSLFCAALFAAAAPLTAATVIIDFDSLSATSTGTLFPGNTFASSGVTFTSGSIPNTLSVGSVFTLASIDPQFLAIGNSNSISSPNFAAASGAFSGAANDLLMSFSIPVTSVQLTTDDANPDAGGADVVRLLALVPTSNPNEYQVLALASGLDDATTAPANQLSVSLGGIPFSYALFQATSEPEGIDDLTVQTVPEPSATLFGVVGSLIFLSRRTRSTRRA